MIASGSDQLFHIAQRQHQEDEYYRSQREDQLGQKPSLPASIC